jgi:hypothetical protein
MRREGGRGEGFNFKRKLFGLCPFFRRLERGEECEGKEEKEGGTEALRGETVSGELWI